MKNVIMTAIIMGSFAAASFASDEINTKAFNMRIYGMAEQLEYKDVLAKESGQLVGVGGEAGLRIVGPLRIEGRGELFGGTVDHETHLAVRTSSGRWVKSDNTIQMDSEYTGAKVEGVIALKLPVVSEFYLKPYAGVGNRSWTRKLDDNIYGLEEDWSMSYSIVGCGGGIGIGQNNELFGRLEARLPFDNSLTTDYVNYTGIDDNEIEPHKDPSVYAEAGVKMSLMTASLFVETLEFDEPDPSAQKTTATMTGLKLGLAF
jgi:hypothetical protein